MSQTIQSTGKLQLSENKVKIHSLLIYIMYLYGFFIQVYDFTSDDLQDLGEIGRGGFGTVNKMLHRSSDTVMAVKVFKYIKSKFQLLIHT